MAAIQTLQPLILASISSARRELLANTGVQFTVQGSGFDEEAVRDEVAALSIAEQALYIAKEKAKVVSALNPEAYIIAGDQIAELEGELLLKPYTAEKAFDHLAKMRGRMHRQHCGTCLYYAGECLWEDVAEAQLWMRDLNDEEIRAYIELDQPLDCCGAFRFMSHGQHLFAKIKGSESVIQGLPVTELLAALYQHKIIAMVE